MFHPAATPIHSPVAVLADSLSAFSNLVLLSRSTGRLSFRFQESSFLARFRPYVPLRLSPEGTE